MMGTIIGALVERGWSKAAARAIAYVGLVLAIAGMIGGVVLWIRHDAVGDYQVKVEHRATRANDEASSERSADTIATSKHEQELHDVIAAQPDQPIAPTSRALACKRLHDAGHHPATCS